MDLQILDEWAIGLRLAADLLTNGPMDGTKRREILKALEPVRTALLSMGFDEGASRRRLVSFLRSIMLANGVIGKRTAHRLSIRTFEEDGEAAMKWLLERHLIEDQGSEGFVLTDEGTEYLDQYKGEFLPPPPEVKRRPQGFRARSPRPSGPPAAPANSLVPAAVQPESTSPF